jgi:very-short-patch-repair endonuclease
MFVGGEGMRSRRHATFAASVQNARSFRKNPTSSESVLWDALRNRRLANLKFRRQYPIGPLIIDFFCLEKLLAIEVDGGIHEQTDIQIHDIERDRYLSTLGIRTIRVKDEHVKTGLSGVFATILKFAMQTSDDIPSPCRESSGSPSPDLCLERGWG